MRDITQDMVDKGPPKMYQALMSVFGPFHYARGRSSGGRYHSFILKIGRYGLSCSIHKAPR